MRPVLLLLLHFLNTNQLITPPDIFILLYLFFIQCINVICIKYYFRNILFIFLRSYFYQLMINPVSFTLRSFIFPRIFISYLLIFVYNIFSHSSLQVKYFYLPFCCMINKQLYCIWLYIFTFILFLLYMLIIFTLPVIIQCRLRQHNF